LDLDIRGWRISTAFKNAYAVEFYFAESPDVGFKLEGEFRIGRPGGEGRVNPESDGDREVAEAFRPLIGVSVRDATARENGIMHIDFENGMTLACGPGGMYEPWEYYGARGLRIFSLPGGSLAVVDPVDEA
jgi:hypothetical protein